MRTLGAVLVTASLALAACGSDTGASSSPSSPPTRLSSTARLEVREPQEGQTLEGDSVMVRVRVTGARVIQETTTDLSPDEGHIHLSLDGRLVNLLGSLEERLTGLSTGPHVLQVEFVAGDHGPFSPRVLQVVTFTVA